MLRTIRKLLGEKSKQIKFPIALMGADAVLSIVLYVVLYMTVIQLLSNTLTAGKIVTYTAICFISVIARLVIYRSAYYLCFARGAECAGKCGLTLPIIIASLSLGYFNQNSSGYLLGTLTKDLTNFELVITHTLPSIVKTVVMAALVLIGTFFINWKLALAECVVLLIAMPVLSWATVLWKIREHRKGISPQK